MSVILFDDLGEEQGSSRRAASPQQTMECLARMQGRAIAVVGDVILDEFVWGEATRISPEAPVPVILLGHETCALGGAANVVANIASLGGRPVLVSILGRDSAGAKVRRMLGQANITDASILEVDRPTTVKQRVLAQNKHVVRIDRENTDPIDGEMVEVILDSLSTISGSVEAVLISDYSKGLITQQLIDGIAAICREQGLPLIVDPKQPGLRYAGATLLKPNLKELEVLSGLPVKSQKDLLAAAAKVIRQHDCQNLLITCGAGGMILVKEDEETFAIPTVARQVSDVTGAGDTVLAALGLAMATGIQVEQGAMLANVAAGVAVSMPGTVAVSAEQLRDLLRHVDAFQLTPS